MLDVSHELRTPVTRMKVALEMMPDSENRGGIAEDLEEIQIKISKKQRLRAWAQPVEKHCRGS